MMRQLFRKTDKSLIPKLPRFTFEGKIVVVQGESEAKRAVEVLKASPLLGIDTETRPAFKRGENHKVALLQVCNEEICFLFRLNFTGLLPCIEDLLSNPKILKVGLSLKDDFTMLHRREKAFRPAGFIDLQDYVSSMGIEDMSLQKLYANVFHKRISKNARLSNWEADTLSDSQKVYAATDAYTCLQLYRELKQLKESGEYEIVQPAEQSA